MSIAAASIGLATVLGKVAIEYYKTKPNYSQKKEQEYREKLGEYRYEIDAEHKDLRKIDELTIWLTTFTDKEILG